MNVFVTGGTGFIGSHLIRRLAGTDHRVYCLVRKTSQNSMVKELGAIPVAGDLTDRESLTKGMRGCEWVMNLAACISFWEPDNRVYRDVNVEGTRNVMEAALESGVSKVVHVSAAGVLGKSGGHLVNEDGMPQPVELNNEYLRSKLAGDGVAWELHATKGLPLVVLYPVGVLGPGDKVLIPYISNLVLGRMPFVAFGDSVLTFVHVKDVADAIVKAAEQQSNLGEKYVVGKYMLSMREFNEAVCDIAGVRPPRIKLPDIAATMMAHLLTRLADLTKRHPVMGLSIDSVRMMRGGFKFDGTKSERELGIAYTPIDAALQEIIGTLRE
ncbi:MAG: NAD-dependent epimerase/dehydratase family protein [Dehalococcoidia bacterium]